MEDCGARFVHGHEKHRSTQALFISVTIFGNPILFGDQLFSLQTLACQRCEETEVLLVMLLVTLLAILLVIETQRGWRRSDDGVSLYYRMNTYQSLPPIQRLWC
jgi:hypothetical protein